MSRRTNQFIGTQPAPTVTPAAPAGRWTFDPKDRFPDSRPIDFEAFRSIPYLAQPLLEAMWKDIYRDTEIKSFRTADNRARILKSFLQYIIDTKPGITTLREIDTQTLIDYNQHLAQQLKSRSAREAYVLVAKLMSSLRSGHTGSAARVSRDLVIPYGTKRRNRYDTDHLEPYTHDETLAFERVCRKLIQDKLALINTGKTLLAQGVDPRSLPGGWLSYANILWYVVNVLGGRYLNKQQLIKEGHIDFVAAADSSAITVAGAYSHLYPEAFDLLPFAILLSIKTGLNRESILNLRRNCIQGESVNAPGLFRVRFTKERGVMEEMERLFPSKGYTSPISLIKTLLHLTQPLVPLVAPEYAEHLFLCFHQRSQAANPHICLQQLSTGISNMINGCERCVGGKTTRQKGWLDQFELKASDGNNLLWSFTRGRKIQPNKRYAAIGNLALVSRSILKHHGTSGTNISAKHYLANETNRSMHEQAVRDAQEGAYLDIRPPVLDVDDDPAKAASALADLTGVTTDAANLILSGEQDVFVAQCKDFFNMPGGRPGEACSNAWACFDCKNAVWTSRILPNVLAFKDFMEEQRALLGPDDWARKFEKPWSVITHAILPQFSPERIAACRELSKCITLYVPPSLRAA